MYLLCSATLIVTIRVTRPCNVHCTGHDLLSSNLVLQSCVIHTPIDMYAMHSCTCTPPHGHLYPQIVPLVEHGEEIEVTELNKLQYLNLLAQYRLAKCAKEEIDHFLKGGSKPTACSLYIVPSESSTAKQASLTFPLCGHSIWQFNPKCLIKSCIYKLQV